MAIQIDNAHKIVGAAFTTRTPNNGAAFGKGFPDTIVIHFTAGSSLQSSVDTLMDVKNKASAHVVIGRDGTIAQLAEFDIVTWHAGRSTMLDGTGKVRSGINQYAIGIEIDNAGPLTKKEDGSFVSWFGRTYPQQEVMSGIHRNENVSSFWHTYPEVQIEAVYQLCEALIAKYNIKYLVGHEEISPGRKRDPGPAFPLDRFKSRLLSGERKVDEPAILNLQVPGIVKADALNIRMSASTMADKVARPLAKGTKLKILEEQNGWYKVQVPVEGWVSASFVSKE